MTQDPSAYQGGESVPKAGKESREDGSTLDEARKEQRMLPTTAESAVTEPQLIVPNNELASLAEVCAAYLPAGHPCAVFLRRKGVDLEGTAEKGQFGKAAYPLKGKRWYVKVKILGEEGEFLVDTGASHSVISRDFYAKLPCYHDNPAQEGGARTANGSPLKTFGRIMMRMEIQEREFVSTPLIAEISDDGILGLDFAALYGAVLEPRKGILSIEHPYGIRVQCELRRISCIAAVVDTVKISPGHTRDVLISGLHAFKGQQAVFEPDEAYLAAVGLESVDTLVGSASWAVLPVSNRGESPIYLQKGARIGEVALINAAAEFIPRTGKLDPLEQILDAELEKLVEDSDLTDVEEVGMLRALLVKHHNAFGLKDEVGRTDRVQHGIDTGDNPPFKIPYRRLPLKKKGVVDEEIAKQLKQGVIVPSMSPWSSPIHLVTKKDGTIRFCIDYRKLNGLTKKNSYPLPRIDETLDSLGGNAWFCTLDLQSGYWQIGMKPEDVEKTAFSSHLGLYEYKVMPFGLCNAPATFEAMMETLLADLVWKKCLVYLDDVIVFGKTFLDCAANLEEVIHRIQANGLKLKPKKCHLFKKSIAYLGRVISTTGVEADPDKLKAVEEWVTPKSPKEIRSFIGFCSYYRDFIPGYSRVSFPMQALAHWTPGKKGERFPWGEEQDRSFSKVKALFRETPVLRYPTAEGHFILDTDASNESIGAALSQIQEGREVPLAFASNSMNKAQRNYCTTKRELLAVVVYTKKFKHFLWGSDFTLRTDHSSLKWLLNFKDAEGMIGRWLAHLSEYGLEHKQIEHRAGVKHVNADALSRAPIRRCCRLDCDDCGAHNAVVAAMCEQLDRCFENLIEGTNASMMSFQQADPICSNLIKMVRKGIKPVRPEISLESLEMRRLLGQWKELHLQDGLLCRWKVQPNRKRRSQVFVPQALRRDILYHVHGHQTSGHFGRTRSIERLARRYYWPGMQSDLIRWVESCPACCLNKPNPGHGKAPLVQELFGVRFARVAVDIISGFETTSNGNTCMMVITDYYTKYTKVFPLPNHTAATCADAMVRGWVLPLGAPLMLHSDQGREFESALWQGMCEHLAICKTRTNPYRPQSDGLVERFNRTLIAMLKPLVNENQDDWDDQVDYVVHAYNSTIHASTNCTPNLLVFGEEIIMPADLVFGVVGVCPETPCGVLFVEGLRTNLKKAYERARMELRKNARWQKTGYDTGLKSRTFQEGDLVTRMHNPIKGKKLKANHDGPWKIIRIISDTTCIIRTRKRKAQKSHVDRLRPWRGRLDTEELQEVRTNLGQEEVERVRTKLGEPPVKRGRGRPRKVIGGGTALVQRKVSTNRVPKKAGTGISKPQIIPRSVKRLQRGRSEFGAEGVRRSERLRNRSGVT